MNKENELLEEIKEKYAEQFEREKQLIETKKITNETEASLETKRFHKELSEYIKKRKKELEISTQK